VSEVLKVLLVEDSPDDAEFVLRELRRAGFQAEAERVDTPGELAAALGRQAWDLVLSDYRMPGFSGMEALRLVQEARPDLPFVLVTGAIGEEAAASAMKGGAHGYVLKDNLGRLGPVVERELQDGSIRRERRRAEEELARSEARYRNLFEHSPVPTAVEDLGQVKGLLEGYRAQGVQDLRAFLEARPEAVRRCAQAVRVLEENQARTRFFQEHRKDPERDGPQALDPEGTWPVFLDVLAALAAGATSFHTEGPLPGMAEPRTVSLFLSVSPGFEATWERVLVSFLDITERVVMQAALRDMDRITAKGQMAAYIAHEINNPLAGIKNAFALLEPAIPAEHPRRHYADLIKREIDRIAGIIRTLYHVHRPTSAERTDVRLDEVFQDIQNLLAPMCRSAGVTLELDLPEPDLRVRCNGGLLRQVLFNLVQNAVEASPRDGAVLLGGRRTAEGAELAVRDSGPGIPPEWAEKVFQPGFTSKSGSGMSGLGLGLATCKNIVESAGGSLDFRSGPGCTFRVRLPQGPAAGLDLNQVAKP
jgi:hypothetical protein